MGKLTKAFGKAVKRTANIALGTAMVLTGAPLTFAGPVVGLALAFGGFACPVLWVGAYVAFAGGLGGGAALMGSGMERIHR